MKKFIYISALSLALGLASCKKDFLETSPTDRVAGPTLFETTQGAQVATGRRRVAPGASNTIRKILIDFYQ